MLSDMSKMIGGNLEISMMNKELALEKIARGEHVAKETVQYEKPGKMILAQGSEILHHVTPVESPKKGINLLQTALFKRMFLLQTRQTSILQYMFLYFRISVIFAFAPANCFQPAKNVLDTMRKLDAKHKLGKTRKYIFPYMHSFIL